LEITNLDDPYDSPLHPEVECHTDLQSVSESVAKVISAIDQRLASSVQS
jgi:adenylylsulfate kinase-like enzyme